MPRSRAADVFRILWSRRKNCSVVGQSSRRSCVLASQKTFKHFDKFQWRSVGTEWEYGNLFKTGSHVRERSRFIGRFRNRSEESQCITAGVNRHNLTASHALLILVWKRKTGKTNDPIMKKRFCAQCNTALIPGQVFCPVCGKETGTHTKDPIIPSAACDSPLAHFTWREPAAVLAAVILADVSLYHGDGFAGLALFVLMLPILFLLGTNSPLLNVRTSLFFVLAFFVSLKLIWCGNPAAVCVGLGVIFLIAALQAGMPLHLRSLIAYSFNGVFAAPYNFADYYRSLRRWQKTGGWTLQPAKQAAIFVPMALLLVFGTIFIFANPDLQATVQFYWGQCVEWFGRFTDWVPAFEQVLLWTAFAWVMIGLLRPRNTLELVQQNAIPQVDTITKKSEERNEKDLFYYAYFNSLISLIFLFGIYLCFEFYQNWTRDFPKGFNYSQHMHQGAAYLALALALSTLVLCTIFRGKTLYDTRLDMLKRLAMIWIVLNFLLAFAVYNRLYIYIDLNGLSWRRILGLLGSTCVVLGLIMVMRMILLSQGIRWLVYRYAWSVLAVVFIGYVFPFSWYISHYNVSRVMKGDIAPSIFLFPESWDMPEHYLASLPLLESEDEILREGAMAFFADYYSSLEKESTPKGYYRWTSFQWSKQRLIKAMEPRKEELRVYMARPIPERERAIQKFRMYTRRWI